ncbi:Cold shock domain family protein [hydrothermal vent metagenome]|uniref:Cold shock domain family protein n=1 Tax=hydrothermal vent metagenome TaxID=652676 RepID=A0A1W1BMJ0_9ZZZZ
MKIFISILIFLVGGWYYLVNFHYAIDKDDKTIESYMANDEIEEDVDINSNIYEDQDTPIDDKKSTKTYSKKQDTVADTNIHYSVYDEESSSYKCDGRTRCTQMRSCAEAKFFLANCKGVMMDGDGNGIPCESQWCGGGMVY